MAVEVASLFASLNLRDNMTDGLNKAKGGLTGFSDHIKTAGTAVSGLGKSMLAGTAPMVAALGIAVTSAMGFNESLTNIQAVTGQSAQEIDALGDTILDMDTRFSSVELANTFYDIAGGVTDTSARMDVFNTAVHVAQAGNSELQGTTAALIGTMNAYAESNMTAATAGDILVRTVGMGVGTMDQFAAALPKVTGLAASVGVSFEEIAAATAFLTTKGNTASEATTQLSAAMNSLLNPNLAMTEAFKLAGIESGSLALSQNGLIGTLDLLKEAFGGNIDAMAEAFGGTEALRAAISLTGGDVDAFFASFSEGVDGATAAAEDIQMQSAAAQFDMLKSSLQDVSIEIGNELLPVLIDLGNEAKPVVRSFADFIRQNPQTVRTVAMVAAGIAILGAVLVPVGMAITAFGTVLGAVGAIFGIMLSPIGLVVLAVGGLAAAIYFLSGGSLADLNEKLQSAVGWIKTFASGLIEAFQTGGLSGAGDFIQQKLITPILNAVANADWNQIADDALALMGTAFNTAAGIFSDAGQWFYNQVIVPVWDAARTADWGQITQDVISGFFDALRLQGAAMESISGWVEDSIISPIGQAIKEADKGQIAKDLVQGLWDGLVSMGEGILDLNKWVVDNIINPVLQELGIASASAVFFQMATDIALGLINGLMGSALLVLGQVASLTLGIVNTFTSTIGDMAAWVSENIIGPMVGGFMGAIGTVTGAANAIANAVIGPLNAIAARAAQVASAVANVGGSVVSSAIGSPIGGGNRTVPIPAGLQLPGRAGGGAVYGNSAYVVGERGPEVFVPGSNGRVIPNSQMGAGGGGIVFNGDVYFMGIQNIKQLRDEVMKENGRRAPMMAGGMGGLNH